MNITKSVMAFAIAASAFTSNANAGIFDVTPKIYGMPAPASLAQRHIDITSATKKVDVTNGETITFHIDGKPFTWKFDLYTQAGAVELSFILPNELHADGVTIVVAENPLYRELYRN